MFAARRIFDPRELDRDLPARIAGALPSRQRVGSPRIGNLMLQQPPFAIGAAALHVVLDLLVDANRDA